MIHRGMPFALMKTVSMKSQFEMPINQLTRCGSSNPGKLFLIDGFGALFSAFLLGIVLVRLEHIFGIPRSILYFLAVLPCFFAAYDFTCYLRQPNNPGVFIKAIAIVNLCYCGLSFSLAIYHSDVITYFGWVYILVEIILVVILSTMELRIARNLNSEKSS